MLFAAGVAVGIFYYGVSEPIWHQQHNWYTNAGYHSQDEIDQFAMNQTIVGWGIVGWAIYTSVAVAAGLGAFRFNLPLTFRSCFYPILGEYTWGWIGDLIDGFCIVMTVAGVCTSLGLGAIQIPSGLQRMGFLSDDISDTQLANIRTATIWVITMVATASVMSGLSVGIKYLSFFGKCFSRHQKNFTNRVDQKNGIMWSSEIIVLINVIVVILSVRHNSLFSWNGLDIDRFFGRQLVVLIKFDDPDYRIPFPIFDLST